ncbi:DUF1592 domain-containing protein [Gemmata sp. G18]|uniref:DUF1592 domain-containing protein n=1 Tax=Gemmata palustris TaxID=2822762 RepID=A0ABS5C244_9BACT|nr:DUF1592 domain-containing protein [Gemmata palustris]MBP3960061.1 DUF1592 domain-containing protein [Gemmata palustris]
MLRIVLIGTLLTPAVLRADGGPALTPDDAGYTKTVEPFFKAYCNSCHTGEKPKGDFRVDATALPNNFLDPGAAGKWKEIVNVLGSHEMPPKKARQPLPAEVSAVVDWVTGQTVRAELVTRSSSVTLRRLNRDEYRNTIRDLVGVDFDVSGFPQDPAAGGFDNNGGALTMSPLQVEMYLNAARQILDRALVEGDKPKPVKWRFNPRVGPADRTRVRLDAKNNAIVNGGQNTQEGDWVVIHHEWWNKSVGAREFQVPTAGDYVIRIHAAGRAPGRSEVVKTAETYLAQRRDEADKKNPKGAQYNKLAFERDLEHFKTDRMYDYGPPRAKVVQQLGPQPRTLAEFDASGTKDKPRVHEFTTRFTTETAGVSLEYAYRIPRVLENFWFQEKDDFPRPELMIDWFEIEGPVFTAWPPPSHTGVLFDSPTRRTNERGYASEALERFMRKAYRRPVAPSEVAAKMALYDAARKGGATFVEAMKRPLTAVLVSPHFLFLVEPAGPSVGAARPLTDHEIAARLSYFLGSSAPDADLTKLADAGALRDRAERLKQIDRLLAGPRREAFVRNFAGQWLNLREVGNNPPAPDLYPQYDRHLEDSIVKESEAFFRTILDDDLDARNFIKSDFVVINERLARFYGIPGVRGDEFQKVPVPKGVHRGGIVTQASVLTTTSNGTRTSPVKRGTWVLKTLLGVDPGLPLANVGEIAPKVPGIDKATVRKRLEIHRQLDQCARCHNKIDPLGFALENFNAAGEWREQEGFGYKGRVGQNDPKIDASARMIDGTKIVGVDGLQAALLKQEDLFLQCLAGKVLTYALGRQLGLADQPTVKAAVAHMKRNGRTLKSLIRFVATCDPFETK